MEEILHQFIGSLSMFIALFIGVLYIPGGDRRISEPSIGSVSHSCSSNRFSLSFKCCGGTDDVEAGRFLWGVVRGMNEWMVNTVESIIVYHRYTYIP